MKVYSFNLNGDGQSYTECYNFRDAKRITKTYAMQFGIEVLITMTNSESRRMDWYTMNSDGQMITDSLDANKSDRKFY